MMTNTLSSKFSEQAKSPWALAWALWALGLLGAASLWLVPLPAGAALPVPDFVAKLIAVVQAGVMVSIAVLAGHFTARRVGLGAPVISAWVMGRSGWGALRQQLTPAVVGGGVGAVFVALYGLVQVYLVPSVLTEGVEMPLLTRLLYGGITEELLMRWGLLSFLLWASWHVFRRGHAAPGARLFWIVNVLVALAFGAGHLPAAVAMGFTSLPMLMAVVVFNAAVALVYGWLFYRYGLEAAILAHMTTHLVGVFITFPLLERLLS